MAPMMLNLHCQLDWMYYHHGNTPLCLGGCLMKQGDFTLNAGFTTSWAGDPHWGRRRKLTQHRTDPSASWWRHSMTTFYSYSHTCLAMMDYAFKLWAQINPSCLKLLLVKYWVPAAWNKINTDPEALSNFILILYLLLYILRQTVDTVLFVIQTLTIS